MYQPGRRLLSVAFLIDANCVNSRQRIDPLNQLEQWHANGVIEVITSQIAQKEAAFGSDDVRREKAYSFMFTMSAVSVDQENAMLRQIEDALFPNGAKNQNQRNDVEIVFNAAKYMRTLVTQDGASKSQPGGILGNRHRLAALGIKVMTPEEAVAHVRGEIAVRDELARRYSKETGAPLSEWVGID